MLIRLHKQTLFEALFRVSDILSSTSSEKLREAKHPAVTFARYSSRCTGIPNPASVRLLTVYSLLVWVHVSMDFRCILYSDISVGCAQIENNLGSWHPPQAQGRVIRAPTGQFCQLILAQHRAPPNEEIQRRQKRIYERLYTLGSMREIRGSEVVRCYTYSTNKRRHSYKRKISPCIRVKRKEKITKENIKNKNGATNGRGGAQTLMHHPVAIKAATSLGKKSGVHPHA